MSDEIYWLTITVLMTSLFWLVYVLNRFMEIGIISAMKNEGPCTTAEAAWADRAKRAHNHAIENLAIFAPLAIAVHVTGMTTALTAAAAMIYFFARLAHFIIYTLGIPGLRTIAFAVSFGCQMVLGLTVIGLI